MAPAPKDVRLQIRLAADEREMLRALGDQAGEGDSTVVRRLIRAAFAQLETKAPKKKR